MENVLRNYVTREAVLKKNQQWSSGTKAHGDFEQNVWRWTRFPQGNYSNERFGTAKMPLELRGVYIVRGRVKTGQEARAAAK